MKTGRKKTHCKWENTLWYAMEKRKISALEIQHRCKGLVSHSTVSKIRRMEFIPSVEVAAQIARVIGKPIEWVFYNADAPPQEEEDVT